MMELSSLVASVTLWSFVSLLAHRSSWFVSYIKEFGFFFFFKIAVEVSSSCESVVSSIPLDTDLDVWDCPYFFLLGAGGITAA